MTMAGCVQVFTVLPPPPPAPSVTVVILATSPLFGDRDPDQNNLN